jgi:uncharacterized membrane protein YqhA
LKFNLLAVIVVMLTVLFLGVAASFELTEDVNILDYGLAVAAVIAAAGVVVYLFSKVHHMAHLEPFEEEDHEDTGEHAKTGGSAASA